MNFPFTASQFFEVFRNYNETVWPAQILIYALAAAVFFLVLRPKSYSGKVIAAILAFFWLWMGLVYHWSFFAPINPAARIFALLFVLEGLLLLYLGVVKAKVEFSFDKKNRRHLLGLALMIFGPIVYPILGYIFGHAYPDSPTFGLPCPTTIFTIGTLLLALKAPKTLFIIPILWSGIGFMAAISLGVKEDVFLLLAGLLGLGAILKKN